MTWQTILLPALLTVGPACFGFVLGRRKVWDNQSAALEAQFKARLAYLAVAAGDTQRAHKHLKTVTELLDKILPYRDGLL
jgi:hypothetical protein